jgi:hypothetical protein
MLAILAVVVALVAIIVAFSFIKAAAVSARIVAIGGRPRKTVTHC